MYCVVLLVDKCKRVTASDRERKKERVRERQKERKSEREE